MGSSVSSIANAVTAGGDMLGAVSDFAGGGSWQNLAGQAYQTVQDYAVKALERQAGEYKGQMAVIGSELKATQMELGASQMDQMAETQSLIADKVYADYMDQAGKIAFSALEEESFRRRELEATLANQNAISAGNGAEGMSTTNFAMQTIRVANHDIMTMKLNASAEADVMMRNARMERLTGNMEASQTKLTASNTRMEASFVRFGGVVSKTMSLLEMNLRIAKRGTPGLDRWANPKKKTPYQTVKTYGPNWVQTPGFNPNVTATTFDGLPSGPS